ncbi:TIGR02587 family membrane protein [Merismopedia glauca]|uniref:TIGR02587 family membrane protein n=1 Tax=Merismopedia glauca CCAP 1448/3 TaxID=1296344 RepID=A0A2T1BY52_9CYAN|nr:TIGR02587 family membrane protein [Merismopedia glauca]PSB00932.1 TIGR02587 family membrane protein [Merismopedia glauca CCAP 1448/3]
MRNQLQIKKKRNSYVRELKDIIRGICGGCLFGVPLIYTMEVWWIGSAANPATLLTIISITFILLFWLNRTEGFRKRSRSINRSYETLAETIEAMAIGLICSAFLLLILQELTIETALSESVGKIVYESVPFSIGVCLANQLLGDSRNGKSTNSGSVNRSQDEDALNATLSDLGATLVGAIVIAFNIAPTDEIPMLAAATSEFWLLVLMATSLLISYALVFESGFSDQQKRREQKGIFQKPISETMACYIVSLGAAALMLLFFQKLSLSDPLMMWLEYTLLLGLPATIGGAAGRLAI